MRRYEEEPVIFVGDLLRILWRRAWVVLLVTVLIGAAATGFSLLQQPRYEASVMLLVGQNGENVDSDNLQGDVLGLQQLTQTLATAVETTPVAQGAIEQTGLEITPQKLLEERINVEQVENTQFIRVDYRDSNPERAQRVANAFGEVFSDQAAEIGPDNGGVTTTLWSRAELPNIPVSPQPLLYGLVGLAAGLLLGVALAFVLEFLDDRCNSAEKAEIATGLKNFGSVPSFTERETPEIEAPEAEKTRGGG